MRVDVAPWCACCRVLTHLFLRVIQLDAVESHHCKLVLIQRNERLAYNMRHATCNMQHATCSVQHQHATTTIYNIQQTTYNTTIYNTHEIARTDVNATLVAYHRSIVLHACVCCRSSLALSPRSPPPVPLVSPHHASVSATRTAHRHDAHRHHTTVVSHR